MTIEEYRRGHAALLSLAAEGPDVLRLRDCDAQGALRYESLRQNVPGKVIQSLQAALVALGARLEVNGAFGPSTQHALLDFVGHPDFSIARGDVQTLSGLFLDKILATRSQQENSSASLGDRADDGADMQASMPTDGSGETTLPLAYPPHFCQADPRWADRVLGQKKTMGKAGCAVTCCAMVVAHYNQTPFNILPARPDDHDPQPLRHLDVFLDMHGGYDGNSLVWGKVCDFAAQHGVPLEYKRETFEAFVNMERAALDRACDLIEQGIFPLLRVRYNKDHWGAPFNHFVLGLRYDGHNLYFHDPGTQDGDGRKDSLDNTMLTQRKGGYRIVGLDYFVRKEQVA